MVFSSLFIGEAPSLCQRRPPPDLLDRRPRLGHRDVHLLGRPVHHHLQALQRRRLRVGRQPPGPHLPAAAVRVGRSLKLCFRIFDILILKFVLQL